MLNSLVKLKIKNIIQTPCFVLFLCILAALFSYFETNSILFIVAPMDGNLLFSPHPKHHFAPYPQIQRIFKYCSSFKPFRDVMSQGCIGRLFFLSGANVIGAPKIPDIFWKPFPKCTVLLSEFRWQIGLNFLQHPRPCHT